MTLYCRRTNRRTCLAAFATRCNLAWRLPCRNSVRFERLQNKAAFSRLLAELDLPQPHTVIVGSRNELHQLWQYPFYLKLPHSTGGGGVFFIENVDALNSRVNLLAQQHIFDRDAEVLVQQPGCGVLSTVQAVFNSGRLVGIHSFEARR